MKQPRDRRERASPVDRRRRRDSPAEAPRDPLADGSGGRLSSVSTRLAAATELARRLGDLDRGWTSNERTHRLQLIVELARAAEELRDAQVEVERQRQALLDVSRDLGAERTRLRDLFDLAPDAYFVTTTNGEVLEANKAAGQLLNVAPSGVVGHLLGVYLFGRDGRPIVLPEITRLEAGEKRRESVARVRRRGGTDADVSMSVAGIRDPRWDTLIGARWIVRDISASVRAENEVRQLNQQLEERVEERTKELRQSATELSQRTREAEEANRAKASFLATMSHEIRTPLNAIAGYLELLDIGVHGSLSDPQREFLRRMRNASAHLLALVNDVLNFAKLESARFAYRHDRIAFEPLLHSAQTLIEAQAVRKGVRVQHQTSNPSVTAVGDDEKVLQIVLNLLSNAVKFTDTGGGITMAAGDDANRWVWIEVRDTGRGIPPEQHQSIFEPFVQVGRVSPGIGEGVGLGLAISRDLARGMGGDLTLQSAVGEGSTFRLTLPRATN